MIGLGIAVRSPWGVNFDREQLDSEFMKPADLPKPLAFPIPFPDVPAFLVVINLPRMTVAEHLGPPMLTGWVEGLGNADCWAFEYPCGLQVAYQFMHEKECGFVLADSPEVAHVQRHIPFSADSCVRIDQPTLNSQLQQLLSVCPERKEEIDSLHGYQVWRQGDDGNSFTIGTPTSKRDAECRVKHFESLGHHQHYWCSRVGDTG